jgi:PBP1b-binding outer membrane lipoprotein LpoB
VRRHLALLALPLILAACDQNTTPPAQPAAQTPAPTAQPSPATPAPAPGSSGAVDTGPITGNWAAVPANCATPIVISATSFEGAENVCEINSLTDNGDGSLNAAMTCQGQTASETIKMTPIFGPTGEGVRLEYPDRGGEPVNLFRCR